MDSAKFADRPICPYCEGRLERRSDDDMSVLQTRLREYNTKTQPLADFSGILRFCGRLVGIAVVERGLGLVGGLLQIKGRHDLQQKREKNMIDGGIMTQGGRHFGS